MKTAKTNAFDRRRKTKLIAGVLAVAIVVSALVGFAVFYISQGHPR